MITTYKLFEDNQTKKFSIPEQIEKFYIIEGDMSNTKNWRTTKYFNDFSLKDEFKESGKQIRYVLISLDSNHIIPININDEHHVGYDVLHGVFYPKYKVPYENYVSVCTWGTHYIYHLKEDKKQQLDVIQKFLDYGGNPKLKIHLYATDESNRNDYEMTATQFIQTEGSFKLFKKKYMTGNISEDGKKFIDVFTNLTVLYSRYITSQRKEELEDSLLSSVYKLYKSLSDIYFYHRSNKIFTHLFQKFTPTMKKYLDDKDIKNLCDLIFSHNGIKEYIHIKLKEKDSAAKDFFWDVRKSLIEFNKMSNIR